LYDSEEIKNAVWKNFCISDTFEPGSTMKPFTVAAAKDAGRISGYETYECNGALEIGEHVIHCHNRFGDGLLTVKQGIAKSCNVVLMDVAFALKKDDWLKYNKNFNFGLKTNIDLAGEVNGAETTFNEKMGLTDLAVASFGQGFNATMIQMISGFSALINGGYYYQPHLVSKVVNAEGAVTRENNPRIVKQVISNETSDMIRDFCNSVVMSEPSECTGWSARPAGYTMGGKTGTAEKLPRAAKNYVISFIGYVPAENPEVIAYIVIDTPNVEDQSESTRLATTLCRDIMTEVLRYLNIFPTLEISEEEQAELDRMLEDFSAGAVSQNMVSENSVSENEAGEDAGEEGKQDAMEPVESSERVILFDPETGYPLDPNTGEVLDPVTGQPVDKTLPSDLDF
ncbi:MAG: cell division protein FtsI, partial [Lachnospiraceae bacterium]|nr:cell division protein FtsI [Lachnospiraceae bacterium]